jgi:hypothetical protein
MDDWTVNKFWRILMHIIRGKKAKEARVLLFSFSLIFFFFFRFPFWGWFWMPIGKMIKAGFRLFLYETLETFQRKFCVLRGGQKPAQPDPPKTAGF